MLEPELALARHRRDGATADEVALDEHSEVRLDTAQQLDHGAGPEHAAHHGSRLERRLLGRSEEVDPRGQDGLNRVRNLEARRHVAELPASVLPREEPSVDQRGYQLFDEEGIAFRV